MTTTAIQNPTFTNLENTKIYNSFRNGWTGETKVKVNGKCWSITTMKRYNGIISTNCQMVNDEGDGNLSFCCTDIWDKEKNLTLNPLPKGTKATEKTIKDAHYKGLAEFDSLKENEKLPDAKKEYAVEVGQILFTDGVGAENARVVYEISGEDSGFGKQYKTVFLDGSQTKIDSYIKNYNKKFGIGVYYKEGDVISQEEINDLLISAHENMKIAAEEKRLKGIEDNRKAEEKKAYLSQFIKADRRTTTNIIKRHILKTFPTVSKVEVKTDVFSGGDSMDVYYYAPEELAELETFIKSFQYGYFDSMNDIYEYSEKSEIIIDGHILETYKYVHCRFKQVEAVAPIITETVKPETTPGNIQIIDYSEKAIAVIGETKPIKEQLKAMGGRFNFRLTCGCGWIFSKTKRQEVENLIKSLNQ